MATDMPNFSYDNAGILSRRFHFLSPVYFISEGVCDLGAPLPATTVSRTMSADI